MKREFTVIIEEGEDGYYISEVVELPGCHTQAKTLDKLMARTKEAIELYLEVEKDISFNGRFLGIQKILV
ncbi:MAG: type II toxin-antitoxin system HicB family antitoxin [Theionarchaea archaeon]|nr:type II toxin-antitoxin system HicB family antitoxin [Theionarchaea archaeon]